jgi:hypothetical protein
MSRLTRHLAALALDRGHRVVVLRFAAVWNARAGCAIAASRMLASASEGARARGDVDAAAALTKLSAGARRGGGGGGRERVAGVPLDEIPGVLCAATLRSLPAAGSAGCATCARCAATHWGGEGKAVACAFCDASLR